MTGSGPTYARSPARSANATTAFYRYPYYHSALDTPEKLNYDSLGRLADGLFHAVAALADEE